MMPQGREALAERPASLAPTLTWKVTVSSILLVRRGTALCAMRLATVIDCAYKRVAEGARDRRLVPFHVDDDAAVDEA